MHKIKITTAVLTSFFFLSCHTSYLPQKLQFKDYRITKSTESDPALQALLKPYADSVNKSMNDVIAVAEVTLDKKQPEGPLGNLVADAMLAKAKEKYQTSIDFSVMNSGGIRLPSIAQGDITRGKIFELSPFDNIIVLQSLNGVQVQEFLNHVASKGGWPVSGMSYKMKNKQAVDIKIGGMPLDNKKMYTMVLLDYVANGGDDASMLRKIPQVNHGYLFRDALIEYFSDMTKAGKKITSTIENRVSYAN